MSQSPAFSDRVLKVNCDGETRRGKLSVVDGATPANVFAAIQATVSALFDVPVEQIWLGYNDEEGDICNLSEHSLSDLACLAPEGVIRLTLRLQTKASPTDKSADAADASAAEDEGAASDQPKKGCDDIVKERLQQFIAKFPPQMLPIALAWVQNMDPAAIHGFLGMALSSNDSMGPCGTHGCSKQDDRTVTDLRELHSMEPSALKTLLIETINGQISSGSSASSNAAAPGMPQAEQPGNPFDMLGALLGGKGKGSGKGAYSSPDANNDHAPPNPLGQLLGSIGPLLASKGLGKGCNAQAGCGAPTADWQSLLQNIFAGKGGGKGCTAAQPSPSENDASFSSDAVDGARSSFEESAADLVNMGLVADMQTARELLTRHGDISSVVAAMSED